MMRLRVRTLRGRRTQGRVNHTQGFLPPSFALPLPLVHGHLCLLRTRVIVPGGVNVHGVYGCGQGLEEDVVEGVGGGACFPPSAFFFASLHCLALACLSIGFCFVLIHPYPSIHL